MANPGLGGHGDAFIPRKTWPGNKEVILEADLRHAGLEADLARKIASAFGQHAEQQALDEEANYNEIEDWLNRALLGKGIRWVNVGDTEPPPPSQSTPPGKADLWVDTSSVNDEPSTMVEVYPVGTGVRAGSAVETTGGQILYVWADTTSIRQGRAPSITDFTTTTGSVTEDRILFGNLVESDGDLGYPSVAVMRDGGRLLMHTFWLSKDGDDVARGRIYKSENEAQSWELLSEFENYPLPNSSVYGQKVYYAQKVVAGSPRRLDDGSLVMAGTQMDRGRASYGETHPEAWVYRSTDDGATWVGTLINGGAYVDHYTRTIGGADGNIYLSYYWDYPSPRGIRILRSQDRGATWTQIKDEQPPSGFASDTTPVAHVFPYPPGPDGYQVIVAGWGSNLRQYLCASPGDPFSAWTEVGAMVNWTAADNSAENGQYLLQEVAGHLVTFVHGAVGSTIIAGKGQASLHVWDDTRAEWVDVASLRVARHDHLEYAYKKHEHPSLTGAYTHIQDVAASVWTINHNLGYRPPVIVTDSAGSVVIGEILYNDDNTVTLTFSSAFAGRADLKR